MEQAAQERSQKLRWVIGVAALLMLAVGSYVLFDPTQQVMGRLAGDEFFESRPARYWVRQLRSGPAQRADAMRQLEQGQAAAVPLLADLLNGTSGRNHADVRWTAAEILTSIGPDAATAAPALLGGLQDPDPHVRVVCTAALPKVGAPAELAVPALIEQLQFEPSVIVLGALGEYRAASAPALPLLVEIVENDEREADQRCAAVQAIGRIGPAAVDRLPLLITALQDEQATVRESATGAIPMIGDAAIGDGVPALISALADPAPRVRRNALEALSAFGSASLAGVPQIKLLLDDPEEIVREAARDALFVISPEDLPETTPASNQQEQ